MTHASNDLIASPAVGTTRASRLRPLISRSLAVTAIAGAMATSMYTPAFALPGDVSLPASTNAHVEVGSTISLTNLDTDFFLTGLPNDRVIADVNYTVTTNAPGYTVSVSTFADYLMPDNPTGTNPDLIPIGMLEVADVASGGTIPMANSQSVTVASSDRRTEVNGDALSTHYEMTIPNVQSDTYSAVIDYVATAL